MSQKIDLKVEYTNKMAQENEALKAQIERLREDSLVAFGDGFYDGYLHYAKLCGDHDFTDDAMRQSELAEVDSIFGKRVGSSARVAEIKADAYWKGYVAGGDDFRSRINIPLEVVTKKANELIVKLYPESESAKKIRQAAKAGE